MEQGNLQEPSLSAPESSRGFRWAEYLPDLGLLLPIFIVGIAFSLHGYFNYGDIGLAFMQTDMMLERANDEGKSFNDLIKEVKPSYYQPSLDQHAYNYALSTAVVHLVTKVFGFSPNNIAYVSLVIYFLTLASMYCLGRLLAGREFGFLISLFVAVSPLFNAATRTGSGIFYYTHILYSSGLLFFILSHALEISLKRRLVYLSCCGVIVSLAMFNGYPLGFITVPILAVFFILFIAGRLFLERCFPQDPFLSRFRLLSIPQYVFLVLTGVVSFFAISLTWDLYTGGEPLSTYDRTIGGTLARQASLLVGIEEYISRSSHILYSLFIDSDKNGNFANGGVHGDTAFPGEPYVPTLLVPFLLLSFISLFKRPTFLRLLFSALFFMFIYVLMFHFQPWAPRVWFPMTFFVILCASDGIQEFTRLMRDRYPGWLVRGGQVVFFGAVVFQGYASMHFYVYERGANKIFLAGQREIVEHLQAQDLGEKNLVILTGDKHKYGWIRQIYLGDQKRINVIPEQDRPDILTKKVLSGLVSRFDKVYVIALSNIYIMDEYGANASCATCKNYHSFISKNYPAWVPEKVVYSESGRPLHYIFNADHFFKEMVLGFDFGGIENTLTYTPDDLSKMLYLPATLHGTNESFYQGTHSARLESDGSVLVYELLGKDAATFYQKSIEFDVWVKTDTSRGNPLQLDITYEDGSSETRSALYGPRDLTSHPGDGQWHLGKIRYHIDKKPVSLILNISNPRLGGSPVYVDQIVFRVNGRDIVNAISNKGFEFQETPLKLGAVKPKGKGVGFYHILKPLGQEKTGTQELKTFKTELRIMPSSWSVGGEPSAVFREDDDKVEGRYAGKLYGGSSRQANFNFNFPLATFKKATGSVVEFSSYINSRVVGGAVLQMGLTSMDGKYWEERSKLHPGDGAWHKLEIVKKFDAPLKSFNISIINRGTASDFILIDKTSIKSSSGSKSEWLPNGNFEKWPDIEIEKEPTLTQVKAREMNLRFQKRYLKRRFPKGFDPLKARLGRFHFVGPVETLKLKTSDLETEIPFNLSRNMKAVLGPGGSTVTFNPLTPIRNANLVEIKNLEIDGSFSPKRFKLLGAKAHFLFRFDFPFSITKAEIMTTPTIFNDMQMLNRYKVSYSTDGEHFEDVQKIRSNGNERYWRRSHPGSGGDHGDSKFNGMGEYTTFNIINPDSKTVYIKLEFFNKFNMIKNSYFYYDYPPNVFKFTLDTEDLFERFSAEKLEFVQFISEENVESSVFLVFDR